MPYVKRIPIMGTILSGKGKGVIGDPKDPIRPVDVDIGNVKWQMIDINIEEEWMEIIVEGVDETNEIGEVIKSKTQVEFESIGKIEEIPFVPRLKRIAAQPE